MGTKLNGDRRGSGPCSALDAWGPELHKRQLWGILHHPLHFLCPQRSTGPAQPCSLLSPAQTAPQLILIQSHGLQFAPSTTNLYTVKQDNL